MNLNEDPRFSMAAERTFLAWIRTGLAMMGFGFVVARFGLFIREFELIAKHDVTQAGPVRSVWIGTALVALGVVVCLASTVDHIRTLRRIAENRPMTAAASRLAISTAILLSIIGTGMAIYLIYVR